MATVATVAMVVMEPIQSGGATTLELEAMAAKAGTPQARKLAVGVTVAMAAEVAPIPLSPYYLTVIQEELVAMRELADPEET